MVGGFVHNQHIRMDHQGPTDSQPLAPAPGEQANRSIRVWKLGPTEQAMHPVILFYLLNMKVSHSSVQVISAAFVLIKDISLSQITDLDMTLTKNLTAIRFNQPGKNFQQSGFS